MAMAEAKHEGRHETRGRKKLHHLEVHPGKNGGHHIVHHHHHPDGYGTIEGEHHDFGPEDGHEALKHIAKHAKIKDGWPAENEAEEARADGSYEHEDEEEGFKEK